jgi:hypothetical protein
MEGIGKAANGVQLASDGDWPTLTLIGRTGYKKS